ncbi:MAG: hypothetical protein NTZ20_02825 [Candidatus Levybacteria bacterium]|nr:hypothetical protein [Candidatus Levybacteria bacterium]
MNTLKKTLSDFAQDLINHCAVIKSGEVTLPEEGLKNLISEYLKTDDPVIWPITLGMIQEEADQELERPLTDIEINRLEDVFFEGDKTMWNQLVFLREAIEEAVNNEKNQWSDIDRDFEEEKLKGGEQRL